MGCCRIAEENLLNPIAGLKKVIMVVILHRKYKIIFINY
jgi:hypothetical protein